MSSTKGDDEPSTEKTPSMKPNSIHSLPDDLIISCLARVSRLHYPILSLVSKNFRSLLASPELYQTRTFLNRTENCLYVRLQFPSNPKPSWFTLCKKPNQTLTNKKKETEKSSSYVLAPISILNSPTWAWSYLMAAVSNIYAIRAINESPPCSNISYLDCRTHTWLEAPSLRIAQTDSKFDGKLYLRGSNENQDSSLNCIEVFNTKTQTWNHPVPPQKQLFNLKNMEGKIVANFNRGSVKKPMAYNTKESTWELDTNLIGRSSVCMIKDIVYRYSPSDGFRWSATKSSYVRRKLKGLEGLPKFSDYSNVKLVNYGGKLMVLWDKHVPESGYMEKMIWCAVIELESKWVYGEGEVMFGKIKWIDAVLRVPKSYRFADAIAVTV